MNLSPCLTPYTKINSKWIKHPNVRDTTITFSEENRVVLHDLELSNGFIDVTPKTQATKEKLDKLSVIQILTFCTSKDTIKEMKDNLQNSRKYLQAISLIRV